MEDISGLTDGTSDLLGRASLFKGIQGRLFIRIFKPTAFPMI